MTVTAVDDAIDEEDESFTITHAVPSTADTAYNAATASDVSVIVTDNDTAGVTISEGSLTIEEGNTGTYTVMLNTKPADNVTVTISGHASTDVSVDKTTLLFTDQNWGTAQTVTTEEDDDSQYETDVTLSHAVPSTTDTLYNAATASDVGVTVTDNDVASVTVSFEQVTYTVAEGGSITVKLSADPERMVMIPISKDNQGGATSAGYSGVPENVTFNSVDMEKNSSFTAASDSFDDDVESVKLGFSSNLPGGVSEGSVDETVVSITDDDVTADPQVTVQFPSAGTPTPFLKATRWRAPLASAMTRSGW